MTTFAHPAGSRRSLVDIDVDLFRASLRKARHRDAISRRSIMQAIDGLLDERLGAMGRVG